MYYPLALCVRIIHLFLIYFAFPYLFIAPRGCVGGKMHIPNGLQVFWWGEQK